MKRYALIISNAGEPGEEHYCKGVAIDVANYVSFLTSGVGGYWKPSEIEKLDRPSAVQVREKIKLFSGYDYVLVIFAGHGWYSTTSNSTVLALRKSESLDSSELRRGAPKQTLILDCCREKSPSVAMEMRDMLRKSARQGPAINPAKCRKYYDMRIEECSSGIAVLHACTPGETAGDDPLRGGYYSSSILDACNKWVRDSTVDTSHNFLILSVVAAHTAAAPGVKTKSGGRQNPMMEKPRTENFFPFCVIA